MISELHVSSHFLLYFCETEYYYYYHYHLYHLNFKNEETEPYEVSFLFFFNHMHKSK